MLIWKLLGGECLRLQLLEWIRFREEPEACKEVEGGTLGNLPCRNEPPQGKIEQFPRGRRHKISGVWMGPVIGITGESLICVVSKIKMTFSLFC